MSSAARRACGRRTARGGPRPRAQSRAGLVDEREAFGFGRAGPPPRDDDRPDAGGVDLAHLRRDDLRVRRRVEPSRRVVRRRENVATRRARRTSAPSARPAPASSTTGSRRSRRRAREEPTGRRAARRKREHGGAMAATPEHEPVSPLMPRGTLARPPARSPAEHVAALGSAAVASYRYLIVGGGMTGARVPRDPRARHGGLDRPLRRGPARAVRAAPAHQGALEGASPRTRSCAARRELGVDIHTRRRSSRSTSRAERRRTAAATSTRTSGSCSRRAGASPAPERDDGVLYFRTLDHYRRLAARQRGCSRGDRRRHRLEIAAALTSAAAP